VVDGVAPPAKNWRMPNEPGLSQNGRKYRLIIVLRYEVFRNDGTIKSLGLFSVNHSCGNSRQRENHFVGFFVHRILR
jgi:hypothetical protein